MAITLHNSALNNSASGTTTIAATLTASIGEIVVVKVTNEAVSGAVKTVSTVSDGTANVYHKRFSATQVPEPGFGASEGFEIWWAYAANALVAATITATMSGTFDDAVMIVAGYQGFTGTAYQIVPWDINISLPATAQDNTASITTPTVSGVSTTSTAGMLLAGYATTFNGFPAAPTGFTLVQQGFNSNGTNEITGGLFGKVYALAQSSVTIATTTNAVRGWIIWADALTDQGSAPPPSVISTGGSLLPMMGVG